MDTMIPSVTLARRRCDAGHLQVTERDMTVLRWIGEQYTIHLGHLRVLLGQHAKAPEREPGLQLSNSATRHALWRWQTLGLIEEPYKLLSGTHAYVWLTRKAIAQIGLSYPYYRPKLASLPRINALNSIRLDLAVRLPAASWMSARALSYEVALQRGKGYRVEHSADGELRQETAIVAVKVVLTPCDFATLLPEVQVLLSEPRYQAVWCYCSQNDGPAARRALASLSAEHQPRVLLRSLPRLDAQACRATGRAEHRASVSQSQRSTPNRVA